MPEQINDLFATPNEPETVNYVLTSKRYIIRILDIGLIAPELAACTASGELALIPADKLSELSNIEGFPIGPVLIELKKQRGTQSQVISVAEIEAIHFPTVDDRADYVSRQFENVPNDLFSLKATPELFNTESTGSTGLVFPKLNKQALSEKYRDVDMFAGMLWFYFQNQSDFKALQDNISNIQGIPLKELATVASQKVLIPQATGVDIDSEVAPMLADYIKAISKYPVEEGWVSKEILENLKEAHIVNDNSSLFKTWWDVSNDIVNNDRDLIPLTDDKQIVLRAMLLNLLNPEKEAIERMANRGLKLGEKVQLIAHYLAAARQGFSALSAKLKKEKDGAYFLITELVSSVINKTALPLGNLIVKDISDAEIELSWNGMLVCRTSIVPADIIEDHAETYKPEGGTDLQDVINLIEKISKVSTTNTEDDFVYISLDKKALKPITLPKHAEFNITVDEQEIVCNTLLLDLSIASHSKKLTGPKMRAMLEYQTEKGKDFSFNLIPNQSLQAAIRLPASKFNAELAEKTLQQLIDVQVWFKS